MHCGARGQLCSHASCSARVGGGGDARRDCALESDAQGRLDADDGDEGPFRELDEFHVVVEVCGDIVAPPGLGDVVEKVGRGREGERRGRVGEGSARAEVDANEAVTRDEVLGESRFATLRRTENADQHGATKESHATKRDGKG